MSCCDWEEIRRHVRGCGAYPKGLDPVAEAVKAERSKWRPVIEAAHDYIHAEGDSYDNSQIIEKGWKRMKRGGK